jgi:uncharacterized membrane-anchored protein
MMNVLRTLIFGVVALAQLGVPAAMVWQREQTLKQGRVWKFRTAPVDPVDAIRGRYIALRFAAEEFDAPAKFEAGDKSVYAVLKQGTDGFAEVDHLTTEAVGTDDAVPVESVWWYGDKQHVRFPFNKFWVAEANAAAAERAYFEKNRRDKKNAYVTVRVRGGDAVLDQLYIDNQALSDYLRAHSAR